MKKFLLPALAAVALTANAQVDLGGENEIDGIMYIFNDETHEATVTGPGPYDWGTQTYYGEEVNIPEKVTANGVEYTVTAIGEFTFYMSQNLRRVYCPNTITSIGKKAFAAYNLQEVHFGNSLTTIGEDALTTIGYGDSMTDIYITTPTPPVLGETPTADARKLITVHVPGEYLEAYGEVWTGFKVIVATSLPDFTLKTGEEKTLKYAIPAPGSLIWVSSNNEVATVSSDGVVKGIKAGDAVITAKYAGNEVSCNVKVEGDPTGINDVNMDDDTAERYFNLQGVEIANPEKGQVVIVRKGNRSYKTIMK